MSKKDWAIGGGVIGFLLGGPVGAAIGGLIGYLIGSGQELKEIRCPYCQQPVRINDKNIVWECPYCRNRFFYDPLLLGNEPVPLNEHTAMYFGASVLTAIIYIVAASDGKIEQQEQRTFEFIIKESFPELSDQELENLKKLFNSLSKSLEISLQEFWQKYIYPRLNLLLVNNPKKDFLIQEILRTCYLIAGASPPITPSEEAMIYIISQSLGVQEDVLIRIREGVKMGENANSQTHKYEEDQSPYKILGISPDADCQTIKKAYLEKIKKYHPDRYYSLPEHLKELLNKEITKINEAYEELKRMKGC